MSIEKQKKLIKKINTTTVDGFKGFNHRSHRTKKVNIKNADIGNKKVILKKIKDDEVKKTIKAFIV